MHPLGLTLADTGEWHNALEGQFTFLHDTRTVDPSTWKATGVSQLWSYHLHYWEWAWGAAADGDPEAGQRFEQLWRSWKLATSFGRWDEWSPYVVSLRMWVLCNVYGRLEPVLSAAFRDEFAADLALHHRFVRANLELDVGGNHLVKNLKALLAGSTLLSRAGDLQRGLRHLRRQLEVQVLADGGHFERSPSYHCQVLGDLLDIKRLLLASGHPGQCWLDDSISRMQGWLGAMLMPDGDVPLFNDSELVGPDLIAQLSPRDPARGPLIVLEQSGYVVLRPADDVHLVMDVGDACPPTLPAHAHADCLSFELAIRGRRVVRDAGTFEYGSGPRRHHDRSTRAHNTVEVDGLDQTEVWGAFRAGRIAHGRLEHVETSGSSVRVVASHDGYERLPSPVVHRRTLDCSASGLEIRDELNGRDEHLLRWGLNLDPDGDLGVAARLNGDSIELRTEDTNVATGFGVTVPARRVEFFRQTTLPAEITATIEWR